VAELGAGEAPTGSSAYSTGGGGVVFEHAFGATLLAALLTGRPISMLGDEVSIDEVAFQAKGRSAESTMPEPYFGDGPLRPGKRSVVV
jgi:hypothetical protein